MSRKRRILTPDEQSLWNQVAQKIKPLDSRKKQVSQSPSKAHLPLRKKNTHPSPSEEPLSYKCQNTKSCHRIQQVRKVHIDARLDLHGMTLKQAHQRLLKFLMSCQQNQCVWVLIITGKGKPNSNNNQHLHTSLKKTLRDQVPHWLEEPALKNVVSSYATAKPQDGGSGALYVRLKKLKR